MRFNITLLLTCLLWSCLPTASFAQLSEVTSKPLQLNRELIQSQRIKSVMALFRVNTSEMEDDYMPRRESYESYERNKNSDLRKILFFTSLGSFVEYDTAGNIRSLANMAEKSYTTYAYNKQNIMIEHNEIEMNYPTSSDTEMNITYKYDDKGNFMGYTSGPVSVTLVRNNKGEVTSWKVLDTEYLDPEEAAKSKAKPKVTDISSQYQYDKQGRILKQQQSPDFYDETQYSENPKRTTSTSYAKGQAKEKRVHEFDAKNWVTRQEFHKLRNGKLELYSTTTFTYDEAGNLLTYAATNTLEPALNQQFRFRIEKSKTGLPLRREIFQKDALIGVETFYYEHY